MHSQESLTFRDVLLRPRKSVVKSREDIDLSTNFSRNVKLTLPLVSANMDTITEHEMAIEIAKLGGIGIIHRFNSIEAQTHEVSLVKKEELLVGAAIGIGETEIKRAVSLLGEEVDVLVLDVAHAHSSQVFMFLEKFYNALPEAELVVGNVGTEEAVDELLLAFPKIAGIKVGVGCGSACITRERTGCGCPQITAITECSNVARKLGVPICADGGIRVSGDIVKALAFGANTVMLGGLLAGLDETPTIREMKVFRGMASRSAIIDNKKQHKYVFEEGVTQVISNKKLKLYQFLEEKIIPGILSGLSYLGVNSLKSINPDDIRAYVVSSEGNKESEAHEWR